MISAIDTNVLLDVLIPGATGAAGAKDLLDAADEQGALIICEAVYAELAAQFPSRKNLDGFLNATGIRLAPSTVESLYRSGEAWRKFARSRKAVPLMCPACGRARRVDCPECKKPIPVRQHVLADFLVGGHASVQADRLLTRDRGYYRTHFPGLVIAAPDREV